MRARLILVCLGVLAAAAMPVLADDGDDGFFVSVEAKFLKPTNMDVGYTIVDPDTDSDPEGPVRTAELDAAFSPKISFGQYRSTGSGWVISYWSYDEDDTDSVESPEGGSLWDILYNADNADDDFDGTAFADLSLEATTIDFAYWRRIIQTEEFSMTWMAGFRSVELENDFGVQYVDDEFDLEDVMYTNEVEGLGLVGGLKGSVKLGERFRLAGGVGYSFLSGEIESTTLEYEDGDFEFPDVDIVREEDRTFTILEADLALVYKASDKFYIKLGYEMSQWNNVIDRTRFPDDVSEGFTQNTSTDVSWSGFVLGAAIAF